MVLGYEIETWQPPKNDFLVGHLNTNDLSKAFWVLVFNPRTTIHI